MTNPLVLKLKELNNEHNNITEKKNNQLLKLQLQLEKEIKDVTYQLKKVQNEFVPGTKNDLEMLSRELGEDSTKIKASSDLFDKFLDSE